MAVIIEFCGCPGSGKTTLARTVEEGLEAAGVKFRGRPTGQSRWLKLSTIVTSYRYLCVAGFVLTTSRRSLPDKIQALRFLISTLESYAAAAADGSSDIYVFPEGIVQRRFMIFVDGRGVSTRFADFLTRLSPTSTLIIYLHAEPDLLEKRISHRYHGLPRRLLNLPEAGEILQSASQFLLSSAQEACAQNNTTQLLYIDSKQSLELSASTIIRRISEIQS